MKQIFPKKLEKGDTIGLIAPAGPIKDPKSIENAVEFFEQKGYKVKLGQYLFNKNGYLAGRDELRAQDLNDFFSDKEINAIICARGGYGSVRILDKIDYKTIKSNPKLFVGYSDITALLSNINRQTGLVVFHGPLSTGDFGAEVVDDFTSNAFFELLESGFSNPYEFKNKSKYKCINGGITDGELIGGNLAVLCSLIGTKFESDFQDKILFIEDINEPLYKIDRMLQQLKYAGVFNKIKGLLVAEFTGIDELKGIEKLLNNVLCDFEIPVGYGFSASHSISKTTLPIGAKVLFDGDFGALRMFPNIN